MNRELPRSLSAQNVPPWLWLMLVSTAELLSMTLFLNFTAVLPLLQAEWHLSNTQSGIIVSSYQLGYLIASVVLTRLTDFYGVRWIYVGSSVWAAITGLAFGWLSTDFWSATGLRFLAGMGLAGTYFPGMRAVADRFESRSRGTAMGIYVGTFGIGTAFSLWLTSVLSAHTTLRLALTVPAVGPLLAGLLGLLLFGSAVHARGKEVGFLDRGIFSNRAALTMIAAYATHTWELYSMRAWLPPFLVVYFLSSGYGLTEASQRSATLASIVFIIGAGSTAAGGWAADRFGRTIVIAGSLAISGACSLAFGWMVTAPFMIVLALTVVYSVFITSDSGAMSAAVADLATPQLLGGTMALQTLVGFSAATVSPMIFGLIIDSSNASHQILADYYPVNWQWAFGSLGVVALIGSFVVVIARRSGGLALAKTLSTE